MNADAGLTKLTACKNAEAGLTFFQYSGIYLYLPRSPGFPQCLSDLLRKPTELRLHPTELSCNLLSYLAPFELLNPTMLWYAALSFAAPFWATLHPLNYTAPPELHCTLLSYAAPFWAMLHPSEPSRSFRVRLYPAELSCILLCYAHPIELRWTLLSYYALSGLHRTCTKECCILLSFSAPFWVTLHPLCSAAPRVVT